MNRFMGIGTLPREAQLKGENQNVLRFTLATPLAKSPVTKKERWAFVPCVIFRPSKETVRLLTVNTKGLQIGLQGQVNTSKFMVKGQTKYSTDIIVDERTIKIVEEDACLSEQKGAKAA